MPPEQRDDQRRAAVSACEEVGAGTGAENQLRERAAVGVAGLMELRPSVDVPPVGIGAALEQQPHEVDIAGHPEEVVAVRAAETNQLGIPVEELDQLLAVAILDSPVGEHERRRRLLARPQGLDVPAQARPGSEAVPPSQLVAGRGNADAFDGGDPVGALFVVLDVGAERLLELELRAHAVISAAGPTMRAKRGTTSSTLSRETHAMSSSRPGGPYVRALMPSIARG